MKIGGVEITANRVIVALAVLINIQGGIGHGSISMTNMVPAGWIDPIISWNNFLAYVGTAIMGALAAPGAFTPRPVSIPTVVKILLVALALALFLPVAPGHAAVKLGPVAQKVVDDFAGQATAKTANAASNIATALAKPFKDIADFIGADADGAVKLATIIPALQDGHGQQCWIAMKSFGDIVQAHPVPITFHVLQDYETLRLLGIATNNLCSNTHCTQVFADLTSMAQAASPMPLAIPSLHDLCVKVPQIAVVAPQSVPAAPATPASGLIVAPAVQGNPALGAGPAIPAASPPAAPQ